MISDKIMDAVDRGREGLNQGTLTGLEKLDGITDGVTRSTYTVIMSGTGGGKSTFALYYYVYKPIMAHLDDNNYETFYVSLEIDEVSLYIKLLALYIFEHYGIELSYKEILSRKKRYVLSPEHYDIVKECMPWCDRISKHLEIFDKAASADTIYGCLKERLKQRGQFSQTDTREVYTPFNPNLTYVIVVDHISLLVPSKGRKLKEEIDLLSQELLTLRDKCGISPVVIQQANREQGNIERFKQGKSAYTLLDGKDSGNPAQDCNIFIAIYNPFKDALRTYKKYNIELLEDTFRSLLVLKNRYGECDVEIGMNFFGKSGVFHELPKPDEIFDYTTYTNPMYILSKSDGKEDRLEQTEDKIQDNSNLNFII